MKWLIIAAIKLYWILIPPYKRNKCLFNISCSNIVFRVAMKYNAFVAFKFFLERRKKCKPGYKLLFGEKTGIELANGKFVPHANLSITVKNELSLFKQKLYSYT